MTKLTIKTPKEIEIMAEGGKRLAEVRERLIEKIKPGMTGEELDEWADRWIVKLGGYPSFKMVPGYSWATCININWVVVHGVPGNVAINEDDLVSVDLGMYYKGFHTDTSITVGGPVRFLETGRLALKRAITRAQVGNRVGDLSEAMQKTVEEAGYSVVRALTGHGIGKQLHEEPSIPCFTIGEKNRSPKLIAGMVLAIEVMYNEGKSDVVYLNDDGWTIATKDGKMSGLFEDTVAVTNNGPVVLTQK